MSLLSRTRSALVATILPLALGAAGGCSGTETPIESACTGTGPCTARMTFLHTSDLHSRLLPFDQVITQVDADLGLGTLNTVQNVGGVARMAYIIGRERARADRALHVDSGDCFQGAPIFNYFAGEPEVRSLAALGVDAAVIGNHDFDRGAINLAMQLQKWGSYPSLASNYKWEDPNFPNYAQLATIAKPFQVFNREGLKVAVIGMANLSSLTSIFDQPNKTSIAPLSTNDAAQFYIDLLRPNVDLIVMVTHLGLEVDQRMIRGTTGIDLVFGGHNHVVINPPQEIQDCSADPQNPGFIWVADPINLPDPDLAAPDDKDPKLAGTPGDYDPINHPFQVKRACKPRKVLITHSGAFSKYVGRLDVIVSNNPAEVSPTGKAKDYEPVNGFEVISHRYTAFPVTEAVPEDPVLVELLQPYRRTLDVVADLDIIAGYSPDGAKRSASNGGDSALGNIVATGMWLRNGIQTDFSLTNTTGIRADLLPGPITTEQMFNIFPFDNSITKMQVSGSEVQQLFDFVARRSANRGRTSQVQIAGARVRINCSGCARPGPRSVCTSTDQCPPGVECLIEQGKSTGVCDVHSCAEQVYVGFGTRTCKVDKDCADNGITSAGQCDVTIGRCLSPIRDTNLYELATSNYLAGGGSGFRVLQRNTTQFDTKVQQRDALQDYIRQGPPCGYVSPQKDPKRGDDGLKTCATDNECSSEGDFVCACPGKTNQTQNGDDTVCTTKGQCGSGQGRCVRRDCRNQVATFHNEKCKTNPNRAGCRAALDACTIGGESCKILACVDKNMGNFSDGRLEMIGR